MSYRNKDSKISTAASALLPGVCIAAVCLIAFEFFGPLRIARDWVGDLRLASLTPALEQNTDIVVLAITEETLAQFPFRAPVDRSFIANIIETLDTNSEIRALGIDILFDQPTIARDDERLRQTLLNATAPVVVAVGEEQAGLTPAQSAFQAEYLKGVTTGSAILRSQDGAVRNYWPYSPGKALPSFSRAIGQVADLEPPAKARAILFHKNTIDGLPPIRVFPAHTLHLLPGAWFDGKIVMLGSILPNQDQHRTPLSVLGGEYETTPGVIIHSQMLAQMLRGDNTPRITPWGLIGTCIAAILAGLAVPLVRTRTRRWILLGIVLVAGYWLLAFSRFVFWRFPLPVLEPVAVYIFVAWYTLALDRQRQKRHKRFMHDALVHYVAKPVVDELIAHPDKLRLSGEKRQMSFLFTDVAEFSRLAESLPPEQLVGLMTQYFEGLIQVTRKREGTIGRLTGDGLLVLFGAPLDQRDHGRRAVDCALDIDDYCEKFRVAQAQENIDFGVTRIGVHSGPAVVGNIGGSERFEYTAYGDSINAASRLESLSQHLGTRVSISHDSLVHHPQDQFRPVGRVTLHGQTRPLDVFTTWDKLKQPERETYMEVFSKMQQTPGEAEQDLFDLAARLPQDGLVRFQVQRVRCGDSPINIRMKEK